MTLEKKRRLIFLLAIFFLVPFYAYKIGYRFNFTHSVPVGIWKLEDEAAQLQGYVQVSPNETKWYRLGIAREYYHPGEYLLKKVCALEGDVVSYDTTEKLLTVNDKFIPYTEIVSRDTAGREMPTVSFPLMLRPGEAWLTSENKKGYDSRYFGPVSLDLLHSAQLVLKM